ncbi:MAG: hypothetical protein U5L96_18365 [Owenweeksia sp.]|nr:hypothetical protein [Owenweeksia sp.]
MATALLILCLCTGCGSFLLKVTGISETKIQPVLLSNGTKEVVFFPMHHIGVQEFYSDVRRQIDSLNQRGYITLYETTRPNITDSMALRTLHMKVRKLVGFNMPKGTSYISLLEQSGVADFIDKHQLMDQPTYFDLMVDTATAVRADVPLERIIAKFEEEEGEIKLSECDLQTPLDTTRYKCEGFTKKIQYEFLENYILGLRNSELARTVDEVSAQRISVIYGAAHFKGFLEELKERDPAWEKVVTR